MVDRQPLGNRAGRPGREGNELQMPNITARRRQWDKPKKPPSVKSFKPMAEESPLPPPFFPSPNSPAEPPVPEEVRPITSAEQFAITVLLGMRSDEPDGDLVLSAPYSQDPDNATWRMESYTEVVPSLYSGPTPSPTSSVAAVDDEPIRQPTLDQDMWLEAGRILPPYVSRPTKAQKRVQRELGLLGPLTPVQVAQYQMLDTTLEPSDGTEEEHEVPAAVGPFLSSARWESIRSWRCETEGNVGE
ncbi:hypothetical protein B0H14DRAFT_2632041 [Mycena olivaceomarginata]|nr:hypothetical protein B0H14DRAFT_2632041 [Mycena olivaceomarginata]